MYIGSLKTKLSDNGKLIRPPLTFKKDDDWDVANPMQRGFKAAGLKRYKIDHGLLSTWTRDEGEKERLSSVIDQTSKTDAREGAGSIAIKVEDTEYHRAKEISKVITSGEKKISQALTGLKKERAQLLCQDDDDSPRLRYCRLFSCAAHTTREQVGRHLAECLLFFDSFSNWICKCFTHTSRIDRRALGGVPPRFFY